ncbi:hypothetical protein TeGR_g7434, partial [Tetraparma gracilis]
MRFYAAFFLVPAALSALMLLAFLSHYKATQPRSEGCKRRKAKRRRQASVPHWHACRPPAAAAQDGARGDDAREVPAGARAAGRPADAAGARPLRRVRALAACGAVGFLAASRVAALTPISNGNIQQAVNDWVSDEASAISTYGHIRDWYVGDVTNMFMLFYDQGSFNENIGGWDTSKCTNMAYMFSGAAAFDQDISGWDTSQCTDMKKMFNRAAAFDQDISSWDVNAVGENGLDAMFDGATAMNQDLSS